MAEIRVEPKKRSLAWLWILLLIAIAAAVAWYFMNNGRIEMRTGAGGPAAVPGAGPVALDATPVVAARIT